MANLTPSSNGSISTSRHSLSTLIANLERLNKSIADCLAELRSAERSFDDSVEERSIEQIHQTSLNETYSKSSRNNFACLLSLREQLADSVEYINSIDDVLASNRQIVETPQRVKNKISALRLPLENEEYERYGRQLIMPEIGAQGQLRLKGASLLIIGMGGLGCPAAAYLAGAGVGTIGLVDGDTVELSNLHRQILHSTGSIGSYKVDSAIRSLKRINPRLNYVAYRTHISPENALSMFANYDLVLDCTDHPTSRYLISDAAVLSCKPLVSAAALRTDGQLMVLNNPPAPQGSTAGGPCYRCVFPKPPPADSVISCGEGGVLGPVVGVMGVLQALEGIKVLVQTGATISSEPSLLMYSAFNKQPFRSVRLRSRKPNCAACSDQATITNKSLISGSMDYIQFCGVVEPVRSLRPEKRISSKAYAEELKSSKILLEPLIDVREKTQFELCSFPGSINVPFTDIVSWKSAEDVDSRLFDLEKERRPVTFVCRFGNDSQLAIRKLEDLELWKDGSLLRDIEGGWKSWKLNVDSDWPDY